MTDVYTPEEQVQLLHIARHTLEAVTAGEARPRLDLQLLPPKLREHRACFITLHIAGELRGCTGTLTARRPLAEEVSISTVQTAFSDPRFPPVVAAEVPKIHIEISVLTPSMPLEYDGPDDLVRRLRPHVDGVTLQLGSYRSTFLPQVWEHLPDPVEFLTLLSRKMGLPGDAWRYPQMRVETYQSVSMEEPAAQVAAS
ncbi:MAG: AmmeMemoRadiSam system protein A [Anaerolineae bacterium]|nr:AmmeMemoRadiSam system protein A [Anaerolineae bacterium]